MEAFHAEWEWVLEHTPSPLPGLLDTQQLPEWQRLRDSAETALQQFRDRGRLSEDR